MSLPERTMTVLDKTGERERDVCGLGMVPTSSISKGPGGRGRWVGLCVSSGQAVSTPEFQGMETWEFTAIENKGLMSGPTDRSHHITSVPTV